MLGEDPEGVELPLIEYDVVAMATDDFSNDNKLGEGGFGTVYKGRLPDGQEIAVKRLSKVSTQGTDKFKTELLLISNLQHIKFARDEEVATTERIIRTYGYMSPEYAIRGIYSEKSDVFSFGVSILEIVSGKRNTSQLLNYMWNNIEEGTWQKVVDPSIIDVSLPSSTYRSDEILRCINIGLTCVQLLPQHRPTISWVVWGLGNETEIIHKTGPPAYCVESNPWDTETSSTVIETISQAIEE